MTGSANTTPARVPAAAAWLGALGAVPFVALAVAAWLAGEHATLALDALDALAAYGAVILSFLGGIHWGLAIGRDSRPTMRWLLLSVAPSLVAWAALLLPRMAGLLTLVAAVAAMLAVDILTTRRGLAPPWYPRLRVPLSVAVVVCLLSGAAAAGGV